MEANEGILERVRAPTRVVVHRSRVPGRELGEIIQRGTYTPETGEVCELEADGVLIARGKVVRKGGRYWFRVGQMAGEEKT